MPLIRSPVRNHPRTVFPVRRAFGLACVVAALLAVGPGRGRAEVPDPFEVKGISVDVTAETATAAREQALAQGQRVAFRRLLERLTLLADRDRLPQLTDDEIASYVVDFSVAKEKTSSVRYLATLNYRFKKGEVRRLLRDRNLPFAETVSKPVLVLPVYQSAGALLLWDDPNPWRDAWSTGIETDGLVPFILPLGDLADVADIGAEQAVKGDAQRLSAIAKRYGTGDTLVAQAIMRMNAPSGLPEVDVYVTRYGSVLQEQTVVMSFAAKAGESVKDLLKRAAVHLSRQVEDNWKRDNLLQFTQRAVLAVRVPIDNLRTWLSVRDRLDGVAVVRRAELVLLSRTEARVNLHYIGRPEQLALALQQADLTLTKAGDQWILGLAPSAKGS